MNRMEEVFYLSLLVGMVRRIVWSMNSNHAARPSICLMKFATLAGDLNICVYVDVSIYVWCVCVCVCVRVLCVCCALVCVVRLCVAWTCLLGFMILLSSSF